jgi:hypothetical protein
MEQLTKPLPRKKEYTHPVLTDHGTLARLTQGGPTGAPEGGLDMGPGPIKTCL